MSLLSPSSSTDHDVPSLKEETAKPLTSKDLESQLAWLWGLANGDSGDGPCLGVGKCGDLWLVVKLSVTVGRDSTNWLLPSVLSFAEGVMHSDGLEGHLFTNSLTIIANVYWYMSYCKWLSNRDGEAWDLQCIGLLLASFPGFPHHSKQKARWWYNACVQL